jgi:uncharacterized protein YjbI with pentapeptide repeats
VRSPRRKATALLAAAATLLSTVVVGLAAAPAANAAINCPADTAAATAASGTAPDWSGCDLTDMNLNSVDLSNATLISTTLSGTLLSGTRFDNAVMSGAFLNNTWGTAPSFNGANLTGANLTYASLREADFTNAMFDYMTSTYLTDFSGGNFTNVTFNGQFSRTDFTNATAHYATFTSAIDDSVFTGLIADNVTFTSNSFAPGANFTNARLHNATFTGGFWVGSTFDGADLTGSNTTGNLELRQPNSLFTPSTICGDGQPASNHPNTDCTYPIPDDIDPTVTGEITAGTLGNNGWYTSDVTITWTCTDNVAVHICPEPTVVTSEGADQTIYSEQAFDTNGNIGSGEFTVSIDKTRPTIGAGVTSGFPNTDGTYTAPVTVEFTCSDNISGIDVCQTPQAFGVNGPQTYSGIAIDEAGNTNTVEDTITVTGGVDPFSLTTPVISGVLSGKTYPYGTRLTPTCTASIADIDTGLTAPMISPKPTCTGTTTNSTDGRTHTYKATATLTLNGFTARSTKSVTWYTAAKPVAPKPAAPKIVFPRINTKSGHPAVVAGRDYVLTITLPKGVTPKWLLSVKTDSTGKSGKPTEVLNVPFTKVKATATTTTWKVTYSPTKAQKGQYRKFAIKAGSKTYTAVAYVRK